MPIYDDGSDNIAVKKMADERDLTAEEADEWMKCAMDKYYFFETYCFIQAPEGKVLFKARSYQKRIIEELTANQFFVGLAGRQSGKALALDTPIATPSGFKTMGDLVVGDQVIGDDGKPTNVVFTSDVMHNRKCYEVKFSTGETIIADADHRWIVNQKKKGEPQLVNTQDMVDAGVLVSNKANKNEARFSIDTIKPIQYEEQEQTVDPYLLGYWLGDGSSTRASLFCGSHDLENIEAQLNEIEQNYRIATCPSNKDSCPELYIHSNLHRNLRLLGLFGDKHIPASYMYSSVEQRIALLQGLMDSDGHICRGGRFEITQKSKKLIEHIHQLICSLGVRVAQPVEKVINGTSYWRICGSIYRDDFDLFRMPRKLERQKQSPNHIRRNSTKKRQIVSITECESVPVKCIQVDNENHLYAVGESFVLTHNTEGLVVDMLHEMIFFSDTRIGFTSYKETNCNDVNGRIKYVYENLPNFLKPAVRAYNTKRIKFSNNSSIEFEVTNGTSFRGKSKTRLVIDEFAFVKEQVAEEFMTSTLPSIMAAGKKSTTKFQVISTPNGTSGQFAQMWFGAIAGTNGYGHTEVKYEEVPGRDEEFEEMMLQKMSRTKFNQEFRCVGYDTEIQLRHNGDLFNMQIGELYESDEYTCSV